MLNKQPVGPQVMVRVFYGRNQILSFAATDDDLELSGLDERKQAANILRAALLEVEENISALGSAVEALQRTAG